MTELLDIEKFKEITGFADNQIPIFARLAILPVPTLFQHGIMSQVMNVSPAFSNLVDSCDVSRTPLNGIFYETKDLEADVKIDIMSLELRQLLLNSLSDESFADEVEMVALGLPDRITSDPNSFPNQIQRAIWEYSKALHNAVNSNKEGKLIRQMTSVDLIRFLDMSILGGNVRRFNVEFSEKSLSILQRLISQYRPIGS